MVWLRNNRHTCTSVMCMIVLIIIVYLCKVLTAHQCGVALWSWQMVCLVERTDANTMAMCWEGWEGQQQVHICLFSVQKMCMLNLPELHCSTTLYARFLLNNCVWSYWCAQSLAGCDQCSSHMIISCTCYPNRLRQHYWNGLLQWDVQVTTLPMSNVTSN